MNPKHYPQTEELKLDHIIEEASEVIKACIKIKRFGKTSDRLKDLKSEVEDVRLSFQRYQDHNKGREVTPHRPRYEYPF